MKNQIYQDQIYTGRSLMLYPEELTALELKQCSCRHIWNTSDLSYKATSPVYIENNEVYCCGICGQSWDVKNIYLSDFRIKSRCATARIYDFSRKIDNIYSFLQDIMMDIPDDNIYGDDGFFDYISYAIQNIYRIKKGIDSMQCTLNLGSTIIITDEIMNILFIVEGYMFAAYNTIPSSIKDLTLKFENNSVKTIMNTPTFIVDVRDSEDLYKIKLMSSLDYLLTHYDGKNNQKANSFMFVPFGIQICEICEIGELQYLNKRAEHGRSRDENENYEEE